MSDEQYQISAAQGQMLPAHASPSVQMPPPSVVDAGSSINIAGIVSAFRRRWWLVLLCAVFGGGLAVMKIMRSDDVFESRATVEVAQGKLKILKDVEELNPEDLRHLEVLKTIEQSFGSKSLFLRVIAACELRSDPDFQTPAGEQYSDAILTDIIGGMVTVSLRRGTRLIDVVVRDTDPERARKLAESVVKEYDLWEVEQGRALALDAQDSLAAEAERLRSQLERSEAELLAYREEHRALSLEGKETVLSEKAKALNAELAKTKAERMRLESDLDQIGDASGGTIGAAEALALPSVAARPEIVALRGKVSEKRSEFAMIKKRYKHKHPSYIKVDSELQELVSALDREAMIAASSLRNTSQSLAAKEQKLEGELAEQREELIALTSVLLPYKALVRDVEANRGLYEGVRTRLKEAAATGAVESSLITLKEAPLTASQPILPRKKLILGLGLIAGVALGSVLVLAGELINPSFRSGAEAERALAMPLLAQLPKAKGGGERFEPGGEMGEGYRSLRTSLAFVGKGTHARRVVFTSSREDEGGAECAANCAAAFARQGYRTLLIDADLRSPTLDIIVTGSRVGEGLAHYLSGAEEPKKVVKQTQVENLYLLSAGAIPPDSGALLAGERLGGLISESLRWFHKVVISASSLDGAGDGLLVARHADSVCLVVGAGATPRREVLRACSLLTMAGAPPVGFVLTGVGPERGGQFRRGFKLGGRRQVLQEA